MSTVSFDAREAVRSVTINVKVTGVRRLRARLWLAEKLFRLGAVVAGCGIEIDTGEPPAQSRRSAALPGGCYQPTHAPRNVVPPTGDSGVKPPRR
ncbi:MAG TPA: hypothetical protein VD860_16955 [Azospirillum sp.]|nr:hypothetical protein [Azospirillum sp.]